MELLRVEVPSEWRAGGARVHQVSVGEEQKRRTKRERRELG